MTAPLDDSLARRPRRIPWGNIVYWGTPPTLLVVFLLTLNTEVFIRRTDVDAVTGSTRSTRVGPFGINAGQSSSPSPLEMALAGRGIPYTPRWQHLTTVSENLFGRVVGRGCSAAPPGYDLRSAHSLFLTNATNADIVVLIRTLETGTDSQQAAAVKVASDLAFAKRVTFP